MSKAAPTTVLLLLMAPWCTARADAPAPLQVELTYNASTNTVSADAAGRTLLSNHQVGVGLIIKVKGENLPSDLAAVLGCGDLVRLPPRSKTASSREFALETTLFVNVGQACTLGFVAGGKSLMIPPLSWTLMANPANDTSGQGAGGSCLGLLQGAAHAKSYLEGSNQVLLYYDQAGRRLNRLPENIDANDDITVVIIAPQDIIPTYAVEVVSGAYDPGFLNIYAGADLSKFTFQSTGAALSATCGQKSFNIGRFTTANVIFKISGTSNEQTLQVSHTLKINPLYHGTIRLAAARSRLENPTFGLVTPKGQTGTEIFISDEGDNKVMYVLEYVPFVLTKKHWAGRDILKPPSGFERLNFPVIGFSLNRPKENVFLGLELELARGISLAAGVHYGKHRVLADDYDVGDPFTGSSGDIPTSEVWDSEAYFGVSMDLLVVTKAFSGMFGSK